MKTKTDISYGVIPVRQTAAGLEFLLIHQFSSIKQNAYWTFPKGHPEGNETPQQTATRELREETGLTVGAFLSDQQFKNEYSFTWEDTQVNKTVAFYLARVQPGEMMLQEAEVHDAKWLPPELVLAQLDYEGNKILYQEVLQYLADNKGMINISGG